MNMDRQMWTDGGVIPIYNPQKFVSGGIITRVN